MEYYDYARKMAVELFLPLILTPSFFHTIFKSNQLRIYSISVAELKRFKRKGTSIKKLLNDQIRQKWEKKRKVEVKKVGVKKTGGKKTEGKKSGGKKSGGGGK